MCSCDTCIQAMDPRAVFILEDETTGHAVLVIIDTSELSGENMEWS